MNTNNQPLVSILMAYYNNIEHVEDSIKSVYAQTYKNWELIVVDDCSPSVDAQSFIKSLQAKYGFTLIRPDKNQGAGKSFQTAFENSKGDYVAIISHDDMYTEDKIEHSINLIAAQNLDAIYCNGATITFTNDIAKPFDSSEVTKAMKIGQDKVAELISSKDTVGSLLTQGAVYKRRIFEDLSWMRDKFLLDDWPFTIKVWRDYKTGYDDKVVYLYRLHDDNIHKNYWRWFPARVQAIAELVDDDKKLEVLSFMMADIAEASLINKDFNSAFRFASASLMMAETKENIRFAEKVIFKVKRFRRSAKILKITNKILALNLKNTLILSLFKQIINLPILLIPNKELRHELRQKFNI